MNAESQIAPPHAIEAEQSVLGLCMARPQMVAEFAAMLTADMFYDPLHADIYDCIIGRYQAGEPYTPEYVMRDMRHDPRWQQLPVGIKYIQSLRTDVAWLGPFYPFQAQPLAELIIEAARRRTLITVTDEFGDDLRNKPDVASRDMADKFQAVVDGVQEGFAGDVKREGSIKTAVLEYAEREAPPRISTGLGSLDAVLGGLENGDAVVLAGRPSMGKSALALYIALRAAQAGEPTVFCSNEMSMEQLGFRLASMVLKQRGINVEYKQIRKHRTRLYQWAEVKKALDYIDTLPLKVIRSTGRTMDQIRADATRHRGHWAVRGMKLGLIVIDYLQIVAWPKGEDNAVQAVGKISKAGKALAVQLDCPVIALSQLSRQVEQRENKRPLMSDLRESGAIEQDADVIMMMYREHYYRKNDPPAKSPAAEADRRADLAELEHKVEVIIAKQRNGETGTVNLGIDLGTNWFWDTDHSYNNGENQ